MKIRNFIPCLLFINIAITSYTAEALDFLGDLSQAIGEVSKSTGEIAKAVNDASKEKSPAPTPVAPSKVLTTGTGVPKEFQGKWVTNQNNCVGNPDSGVVDIEKNRFYGYEWSSDIKSTKSLGKKLEVVFTTASDGDESTVTSKQTWELNGASSSLSISDSTGGVEKYSRCSAAGSSVSTAPVSSILPISQINQKELPLNCSNLFLQKIVSTNHPNKEYNDSLVACKKIPSKSELTIVVLPLLTSATDAEVTVYDLDILVVKSNSGEVVSNLYKERALESNAMQIESIKIDTAAYVLNEKYRAFGVKISTYHRGGEEAGNEILSLYVTDGNSLLPILPNIETAFNTFDRMGGGCKDNQDVTRAISISNTKTDGYNNLMVNEKTTSSKDPVQEGDECKKGAVTKTGYTIKYDAQAKKYLVPEKIAGAYPSP
jgi:hypothetical protein